MMAAFEVIDKTPAEDKPANGSPGPQMLADLINKPIEEMRAAKATKPAPEAVSGERELVVRKGGGPKVERKPSKIDVVRAKAKSTDGITMAEVRAMTG
jgi:hypothetical protein